MIRCSREPGGCCTTTPCRCELCDLGRRIAREGEYEEFYGRSFVQVYRHFEIRHPRHDMASHHKSRRLRLEARLRRLKEASS